MLPWYCVTCIARFADLGIQSCADALAPHTGGCWLCACSTTDRLCFSLSSYTPALHRGRARAGMRSVSSGRGNKEAFPPGDRRRGKYRDLQHREDLFRGGNTECAFPCLQSLKPHRSLPPKCQISIFNNILILLLLQTSSSGATVVSVSLNCC